MAAGGELFRRFANVPRFSWRLCPGVLDGSVHDLEARARINGDTDAEVLIEEAGAAADLLALADNAASRVQSALAALDVIKAYAAEHAPSLLASNRLPVPASLLDALFLEGFTISDAVTEIDFDYGALDMIVVRTSPDGRCTSVSLCP